MHVSALWMVPFPVPIITIKSLVLIIFWWHLVVSSQDKCYFIMMYWWYELGDTYVATLTPSQICRKFAFRFNVNWWKQNTLYSVCNLQCYFSLLLHNYSVHWSKWMVWLIFWHGQARCWGERDHYKYRIMMSWADLPCLCFEIPQHNVTPALVLRPALIPLSRARLLNIMWHLWWVRWDKGLKEFYISFNRSSK